MVYVLLFNNIHTFSKDIQTFSFLSILPQVSTVTML